MKAIEGFVEVTEYFDSDILQGNITATIEALQAIVKKHGFDTELETVWTNYDEITWTLHYLRAETATERDLRLVKEQKAAIKKAHRKQTAAEKAEFKKEEARIAAIEAAKEEFKLFQELKKKYETAKEVGAGSGAPANSSANMF
jgi:hypothetical protein